LPLPAILGWSFCISEVVLSVLRRSQRGAATAADRSTLRLLWITIGISVTLAAVAMTVLPAAGFHLPAWGRIAAVAIFIAGLALRWWSIRILGRWFTVDVAIAQDHRLVTEGPYAVLRHPSYAGMLLAFLGLGLTYQNVLSLLLITLPVAAALARRIAVEEEALVGAFGEAYLEYRKHTRALSPWIY
jgi:protein-S-isoprenylcysteine O-methyltransferase